MLTGENGILTQAQKAKNETENAAQNEAAIIEDYNNKLNDWINRGTVSIPEGLEIGSEVKYNPSGTYDKLNEDYSGSSDNPAQLSSAPGQPYNIDTWKVLDINRKTGEITLVPKQSTANEDEGTVRLKGAQGYNNVVKLLNDACNVLYGNSSKGITARSININDIEGKMTTSALSQAHSFTDAVMYENQVANAYSKNNSYYPSLYAQESLSVINGIKNPSGLGMSQQTSLVEQDGKGYLQASESIQPYQTYWYGNNEFMKSAFKTEDNGTNYYNLLMPNDGNNSY